MTARPRSDEKAQAIIDAARRCLSEKGYGATTIAEIAAEAGVSRGLLHYYFESKEQLLAQVVRAGLDAYMELVAAMFAQSKNADDLAKALSTVVRAFLESDPTVVDLGMVCVTLARESPLVARELEDLYRQFREAICEGLEEAVDKGIIDPAIPLDALAAVLLAITDGLAMQFLVLPELAADESMWEGLEMAARALVGTGE